MTIGNKIAVACSALVVMTVVLGAASLVVIQRMNRSQVATVVDAMPGIYESGRAERIANDLRAHMLMLIGSSSQQEMAQVESEMAALRGQFKEALKSYEKSILRSTDREMLSRIDPAFDRWMTSWEPALALSRQTKNDAAFAWFQSSVAPAFRELEKTLTDEIEQNKTYGDECAAASLNAYSAGSWWIWSLLLLSLVSGVGLAFFIIRGVNMALHRLVKELEEGAEQVASAAAQIASASQAMAQGASEQAGSLEETSASTHEISSITRQNADNSRTAAEGMARAEQRVQEANRTLDDMIASMAQINESSQKISKIIKVIDEIAFQTNILALNAAVEAARAGEAGMGFAVVADEVRNLAQRSAQAAKDTAALIEESVSKSGEGSTKLNSVAGAIRGMTEEATKVKALVDEVTAASGEQSRGMEQITEAITEMEHVTQRNAASSEESASASEQLSAQAENVKDVVRRLRALVERDNRESHPRPAHAATKVRSTELVAWPKTMSRGCSAPVHASEHEIPLRRWSV